MKMILLRVCACISFKCARSEMVQQLFRPNFESHFTLPLSKKSGLENQKMQSYRKPRRLRRKERIYEAPSWWRYRTEKDTSQKTNIADKTRDIYGSFHLQQMSEDDLIELAIQRSLSETTLSDASGEDLLYRCFSDEERFQLALHRSVSEDSGDSEEDSMEHDNKDRKISYEPEAWEMWEKGTEV